MTVYKEYSTYYCFHCQFTRGKKNKYFPFLLYINISVESYSCCVGMTCNIRRRRDMHTYLLRILNYDFVINYRGQIPANRILII